MELSMLKWNTLQPDQNWLKVKQTWMNWKIKCMKQTNINENKQTIVNGRVGGFYIPHWQLRVKIYFFLCIFLFFNSFLFFFLSQVWGVDLTKTCFLICCDVHPIGIFSLFLSLSLSLSLSPFVHFFIFLFISFSFFFLNKSTTPKITTHLFGWSHALSFFQTNVTSIYC